jgi:hypothetical protein
VVRLGRKRPTASFGTNSDIGSQRLGSIGCPFPPAASSQSVRLEASMSFSLGGIHETARFHHGAWYCGYVAARGPGAATGEDEADRLR